jgi:ubiquinone/menaquinone biosynthesis C-methylase UbiE
MKQAAESYTFDEAAAALDETRAWVRAVLGRVEPLLAANGPLDVLEVGCAQGRGLVALAELGHRPYGIDPYEPALEVARELADAQGVSFEVAPGRAEEIPFEDDRFDLVLAFSVMEHVDDLQASLAEIERVLRPGGIFWFNSASAMSPRQAEISHLPLFGWYPDALKRRLMLWARDNRPAWIGHTTRPAVHWWTPRKARAELARAGFGNVWDRWELRSPGDFSGARASVLEAARRYPLVRLAADVVVPGCSYAARKP